MALTAEIVWFSNADVCAFLSEFSFRQKVHWGGGGDLCKKTRLAFESFPS